MLSILLAERSSFSDDEDVPNVIFQLHLALQFSSSVPSYMALMGGSIFQHKKRNEAGRVNRLKSSLSDLNESFSLFAVENFPGFRKLDHGTYLGLKFIGIVMTRTLPFAITSFSVVSTETRICSYVCSLLHPPTGCKPIICEKTSSYFFSFHPTSFHSAIG